MCYMCHNSHILVKRKMKQNKTIHLKKRANPCFYAVILAFTTETRLVCRPGNTFTSSLDFRKDRIGRGGPVPGELVRCQGSTQCHIVTPKARRQFASHRS